MTPASDHRRSLLTDPGRLDAVRRHRILDTAPGPALDLIAEIAATVCGTPMAIVSIVDADRVWFVAARGLGEIRQVAAEPGLCVSALSAEDFSLAVLYLVRGVGWVNWFKHERLFDASATSLLQSTTPSAAFCSSRRRPGVNKHDLHQTRGGSLLP